MTRFSKKELCQILIFIHVTLHVHTIRDQGRVRLGYSGIYSGYSAPESRIAGMEIQTFRNKNSSQTNAYSHYSNYSYSGLIPNERAPNFTFHINFNISHNNAYTYIKCAGKEMFIYHATFCNFSFYL